MCSDEKYTRIYSHGWNCAVFPLLSAIVLGCLIIVGKLIITPNQDSQSAISPTKFHYFLKGRKDVDLTREKVLAQLSSSTRPKSVYFYIHGFDSGSLEGAESLVVKDAILETQQEIDLVVVVDWCEESSRGLFTYPDTASFTVPKVAEHVTQEVKWIERNLGIPRSQINMAGHSLGAHIMGRTGELLQESGGGKIARMTGLDAAGPMFDDFFPQDDHRLSKGDADFVLCIHTDDILGTTNRTFCHEHRFPAVDSCGVGGFCCRHNSAKKLFVGYLNNCGGLVKEDVGTGAWYKCWRWLLNKVPFRNIVITAHYSTFLLVLYFIMLGLIVLCVTSFLSCCFAARICQFFQHKVACGGGGYGPAAREENIEMV